VDLLDWAGLALRWIHLVVGIGWIGASLYFMWLDASLERPHPPGGRVEGRIWMVHSGGFYRVEKLRLGPGELPPVLHWFKWEAGLTWLSGFLLLVVVYYLTGGVYLVDPAVAPISPAVATAIGVGTLALAWAVYDGLWTSRLARGGAGAATWLSWALLAAVAWALCQVLGGRAAFLHVGALLGTVMAANVWMRIVPAQRELIAATEAGREPDWTLGLRAKQRSTHNSYVTLPVIVTMVSHHYPATHGHRLNWLVLLLLIAVGAGVRHLWITLEHRRPARWVLGPVAAAVVALVALTWPAPRATVAGGGERVPFAVARRIVDLRCASCHSVTPTDDVFRAAPNGVAFDTPESIITRAATIRERTLGVRNMPLANKTGMTERERELLGRWIDQGARRD
jgi:uncharacterized membrane protein